MLSQARAVSDPERCLAFLSPRMRGWERRGAGGDGGAFKQGFHRGKSLSLKKEGNWDNQSHQLNDFLVKRR